MAVTSREHTPGRRPRPVIDQLVTVTPPPRRAVPGFERWVARSTRVGDAVLNIGGGCDRSGAFPRVRRKAGRLVVVDPSPVVGQHTDADERHQLSLEEYAVDHEGEFDAALAVFVLEHVNDPAAFVASAAHVLRPGGAFLAITVNQWHFFGFTGWVATRMHVADPLLRLVRDEKAISAYHCPTTYRLNTVRCATRHLAAAGFTSVEFRMWDLPAMYEPYLPGGLSRVAGGWHAMAYRTGNPQLMGHLTFRAVR